MAEFTWTEYEPPPWVTDDDWKWAMRYSQAISVGCNRPLCEVVEEMALALRRRSSMLLDNLGITVRTDDVLWEAAAMMAGDRLSRGRKRQRKKALRTARRKMTYQDQQVAFTRAFLKAGKEAIRG